MTDPRNRYAYYIDWMLIDIHYLRSDKQAAERAQFYADKFGREVAYARLLKNIGTAVPQEVVNDEAQ